MDGWHDFCQVDLPINRGPLRLLKISFVKKETNLRTISSILLKENDRIIKNENMNICAFLR